MKERRKQIIRERKIIRIKRRVFRIFAFTLPIIFTCSAIAAITKLSTVENEFIKGTVTPAIQEEFENGVKSDVAIKNDGNSPIYVRVSVIYNYIGQNDEILFETPVLNTDYTATFSNSSNWLTAPDGYFYYKNILEPNTSTDILIDNIEEINSHDDKALSVSILTQSIQAYPDSSVREAWPVNINNGVLSLRSQ